MKVSTVVKDREKANAVDFYMCTDTAAPVWAMLRHVRGTNVLRGYVSTSAASGLAVIKPIQFDNPSIQDGNAQEHALFAFMAGAGLKLEGKNSAARPVDINAQVAQWENFLGGSGKGKNAPTVKETPKRETDYLELTDIQVGFLKNHRMLIERGHELHASPSGVRGFNLGEPISGLSAYDIQKHIHANMPSVQKPPSLNLEAAKEALASIARPSSNAVAWYGVMDETLGKDRAQAAKSFPVLAALISDSPVISDAVDSRKPIQPLLMERTGLGKGALKRVGKLSKVLPASPIFENGAVMGEDALGINRMRRFATTGSITNDNAIRYLSMIDPDRVPQDDRSWMIFHDILVGCAIPLENAIGIPAVDILNASKGNWVDYHATLARAADCDPENFDRRILALTSLDVIEAIEDVSRCSVLPLILSSIRDEGESLPFVEAEYFQKAFNIAAGIVIGQSKNVAAGLFEMARRYASRIPALAEATGISSLNEEGDIKKGGRWEKYGADGFPPLTGDYVTTGGMHIFVLKNKEMMVEEGNRQQHCVGAHHVSHARRASDFYFSLRSEDGLKSHSTLRLYNFNGKDLDDALANLAIGEHQTFNNGWDEKERRYKEPGDELKAAVDEFLQKIKRKEIPVNYQEISDWRQHLKSMSTTNTVEALKFTWDGAIGMDWGDRDKRENSWQEIRYIIGGKYGRSEHPGVLWSDKDARSLLAEMSPVTAGSLERKARLAREARESAKEPATDNAGPGM